MRKIYFSLIFFLCAFTGLYAQNVNVSASAGTPAGSYLTLKAAFDAINAGTHQGNITIDVVSSTVETVTAVLMGSGTGAANYTSVLIKPTALNTISGTIAGPLVDLNGADNVTIDGRVGAAGSTRSLTISNLSATTAASTSTVRYINDASNNALNYVNIQGSAMSGPVASGTILIDSSTVATGNTNITISNNDIGPAGANTPWCAIYSIGESAILANSNIAVTDNSIHDFFASAGLSSGILTDIFSTGWSVTGNSFYQTATRTSTAGVTHIPVYLNTGNGFIISGNYIGGSGPLAGGAPYVVNGAFSNYFVGVYVNVGTTTPTNLNGNTIANINFSSQPTASVLVFNGIRTVAGNVNIGTTTGNTIGALTGTGSIVVNSTATAASFSAFVEGIITSTGSLDIRNNIIGSLTVTGLATAAYTFRGIEISNPTALTIQNNTIGGTTANSIQSTTVTGSMLGMLNFQGTTGVNYIINGNTIRNITNNGTGTATASIVGIQNQATSSSINVTNTITNNNITNLSSPAISATAASVSGIILTQSGSLTNTTSDGNINNNQINNLSSGSTSTSTLVRGIVNANPFPNFLNINNNIIHTLTSSSLATTSSASGAATGISQANTFATASGPCTISGNTIYNIENNGAAATHVIGIGLSSGNVGNITQNRIYNLRNPNATSTGLVSGIVARGISGAGTFTIANNMISLMPANVQAYGVHNNLAAAQINTYYNSVYIGGTASGTNTSAGFFRNAVATGVDLKNNILYNVRTGGGSHYAVSNTNATPASGFVSDYNNLYTTNPATVALWGAANNDLPTYKTNSGDVNSKSFVVTFVDPANGDLHLSGASVGDPNLEGIPIAGITTDYDGETRNNDPYIGADEVLAAPLPLDVEFFTGRRQANVNLLTWKASCTSSSITFNIERSTDGRRFSSIGTITASQARCAQPFDYTDAAPAAGMNYYRLKMTEADGTQKYTIIIAILNKATGFEMVGLYPTLIQSKATLSVTAAKKTTLQMVITDASGRTVNERTSQVSEGSSVIDLDLKDLARGAYFLTGTTTEGYIKTIRFVKQ